MESRQGNVLFFCQHDVKLHKPFGWAGLVALGIKKMTAFSLEKCENVVL